MLRGRAFPIGILMTGNFFLTSDQKSPNSRKRKVGSGLAEAMSGDSTTHYALPHTAETIKELRDARQGRGGAKPEEASATNDFLGGFMPLPGARRDMKYFMKQGKIRDALRKKTLPAVEKEEKEKWIDPRSHVEQKCDSLRKRQLSQTRQVGGGLYEGFQVSAKPNEPEEKLQFLLRFEAAPSVFLAGKLPTKKKNDE